MSVIISAKTSYPEYEYTQDAMANFVGDIFKDNSAVVKKIFKNSLVKKRRLVMPIDRYKELSGLQNRNDFWINEALKLQTKNCQYFFEELKFPIQDIGMVISTTITGLSIPSLEAKLMNKFEFKPTTKRLPIFGLGCLGGVASINRAHDYLSAYPHEAVLILATELCSLTFQWDDYSMANLVGTSLFADGAGAVLVVGDKHPWANKGQLEIVKGESIFFPNTERIMGWDIIDQGFKLVLSGDVPKIVSDHLVPSFEKFLTTHNFKKELCEFTISHPGGPKVLQALEDSMQIPKEDLSLSYKSLEEHGNMSSVSVVNVLEMYLQGNKKNHKDKLGILLAMGPAFCAEVMLVRGK
jgi:alkylresorcinol/alkylpyrone synthase